MENLFLGKEISRKKDGTWVAGEDVVGPWLNAKGVTPATVSLVTDVLAGDLTKEAIGFLGEHAVGSLEDQHMEMKIPGGLNMGASIDVHKITTTPDVPSAGDKAGEKHDVYGRSRITLDMPISAAIRADDLVKLSADIEAAFKASEEKMRANAAAA